MCCDRHKGGHASGCGCGGHGRKAGGCDCGSGCGCDRGHHLGPAFWTKAEKIAWLEKHLAGLTAEAGQIQERIDQLKAES